MTFYSDRNNSKRQYHKYLIYFQIMHRVRSMIVFQIVWGRHLDSIKMKTSSKVI